MKTFHEKYWVFTRESELRDVLLRSRWKMEGFYESYHAKHTSRALLQGRDPEDKSRVGSTVEGGR